MTFLFNFAKRARRAHYSDLALGNMTDAQLRRAGLSKAEILHRTFSGFYYA
ncbi:hypothetical protein [Aquicoccus porphyridii]|uniref:hypothetical protein n=1 Tax=Aquicoccus porphyridii TaxID=1852029 RepID=UPI00165D5F9E|nr:hypothetical protein [Aquicoccus porphyridii]